MMKTINAQLFIASKHIEDFKKISLPLIQNTRKEEGCIFYNLYQSTENPSDFLFYEQYKDQQAVELHMASKYLNDFLDATASFNEKEPVITVI